MLLVARRHALFVTDGRYTEQSKEQLGAARGRYARCGSRSVSPRPRRRAAARRRWSTPGTRLGLEDHSVTWADQRGFADDVRRRRARARRRAGRRPAAGEGSPARSTAIRRACAIADDAFQSLLPAARRGHHRAAVRARARVRDARARRERQQLRSDHRGRSERREAARPADRIASIGRNELVVCDFGCIVDGYCSDMTRTVSVGDPGADARHLYDVVLASQQAGRALGRRRRRVRRHRSRVARRHRRRGLGRRVLAFDRPRRRSRDPRGAAGRGDRP